MNIVIWKISQKYIGHSFQVNQRDAIKFSKDWRKWIPSQTLGGNAKEKSSYSFVKLGL